MNAPLDDPNGWLRALTQRLRAHYDGGNDAAREADLERRLAQLRGRFAAGPAAPGRFRVTRPIAVGGMGIVEAAIDEVLGREVALKRAATTDSPASTRHNQLRLLTEAEVVGYLEHPGIVPIHDVGLTEAGEPFFAMQHVAGDSLARLIERGTDLRSIVDVLMRVCEIMGYAHSRGIAHRDLKPDNVMVGAFGEVYVMDWGLACALETDAAAPPVPAPADTNVDPSGTPLVRADLTIPGSVLGTPAYLAPERLVAPEHPTAPNIGQPCLVRADVYSLGAILYHALTGQRPFDDPHGLTLGALLATIRTDPPRPVRELRPESDSELTAVCARAMQRDPTTRYPDMQAMASDLLAWTEHRIVTAHGGGLRTAFSKWVRRNRALAATIAAAVVVLLLAGFWFIDGVTTARDAATANLREVLDLAVIEQARDLRQRAETRLWPLATERAGAIESWLREAESLSQTSSSLRTRRAQLREQATIAPTATEHSTTELAWRRRQLDEVIAELDDFFAPATTPPTLSLASSYAAVAQRPAAATALAAASMSNPTAARAWQSARRAIAASPHYRGLLLEPQMGLLPLGENRTTGFYEFAHLQSGRTPPHVDAAPDPRDGLVLVLLPGGRFDMGATIDGEPNHDPMAEAINETPAHPIELEPFFLAKYEMTQAQWLRATGANPSVHGARSIYVDDERAPLHPVESVDWFTARNVLHKLGLGLPTEAQWEYAARAGTSTPWYRGDKVSDLLTPPAGNIADASSANALGAQSWRPTPGLDDGFVMHAPIGSFAANPFGLHDLLGNVAEWCEDEYVSYAKPSRHGDGGRPLGNEPATAMYRGGAFDQPAQEARSANRAGGPPDRRHFALGLRPARRIHR